MDSAIRDLLARLEREGVEHDAATPEHGRRMLNITWDTGEFLAVIVYALRSSTILEVGTSNGYSTIWLAAAARPSGGRVTTMEASADKRASAVRNFEEAGLADRIQQIGGDAFDALAATADESVDLLFVDADRRQYIALWPHLRRVLRGGDLMVVDNACSHAEELAPLMAMLKENIGFSLSPLPVGKGELLAVRH